MQLALILSLAITQAAPSPEDVQEYVRLTQQGLEQLRGGAYDKAIEIFKDLEKRMPEDPTAPYNIACALSLSGKKPEAIEYLRKAIKLGFVNLEHIKNDADLNNIREEKGYQEAIGELQRKAEEKDAETKKAASEEMARALKETEPLYPLSFEFKDVEGKELSLAKLKGTAVLIDVWGTWCPPCVREVPHLIQLQKEFEKKGLVVVGLAFERTAKDEKDALDKVQTFAKKMGVNYRLAIVDREFLGKIPEFRAFPTLIFVDREGKPRFQHVGYAEYGTLAGWAETILANAPETGGEKGKAKKKWF